MPSEETPFQAGLARAIREHLKAAGSWPTRCSEETGHSRSWLSDKLNPKRAASLTVPNIEAVATYAEVDPRHLVADAFPLHFGAPNPKALVHAMSEEHEARTGNAISSKGMGEAASRLSPNARKVLEGILSKRPSVKKLELDIDVDILERVQVAIWEDRTSAFEKAVFQAEELSERPRKLHTLVAVLALLSDLVRTLRVEEQSLRLRLLMHCYRLLDRYPNPAAAAVAGEKTAYLIWDIESDAKLCCQVLEGTELIHHPTPARLFTARASYHHNAGVHTLALAELEIAKQLAKSDLLHVCILGMQGNALVALGDYDRAVSILESAVRLSTNVPADLASNSLALLGHAYARQSRRELAIETLEKAMTPGYCLRWPDKAAYIALDLDDLDSDENTLMKIKPAIVHIQKSLLKNHPVESKLRARIQEMVAAATAYLSDGVMRRNADPTG